jgi:hypothetical protein
MCVDDVCMYVWMHTERSLNLVVNVFRSRRGNTNFFLIRAPTLSEWTKKFCFFLEEAASDCRVHIPGTRNRTFSQPLLLPPSLHLMPPPPSPGGGSPSFSLCLSLSHVQEKILVLDLRKFQVAGVFMEKCLNTKTDKRL